MHMQPLLWPAKASRQWYSRQINFRGSYQEKLSCNISLAYMPSNGLYPHRNRYHIGESTLPSLRHFFKFIDFYDKFDAHGFYHKVHGSFMRISSIEYY